MKVSTKNPRKKTNMRMKARTPLTKKVTKTEKKQETRLRVLIRGVIMKISSDLLTFPKKTKTRL